MLMPSLQLGYSESLILPTDPTPADHLLLRLSPRASMYVVPSIRTMSRVLKTSYAYRPSPVCGPGGESCGRNRGMSLVQRQVLASLLDNAFFLRTRRMRASLWHSRSGFSTSYDPTFSHPFLPPTDHPFQDILPREEGLTTRNFGQCAIRSDGVV